MPTVRTADSELHLTPAERILRRRLIFQDSLALLSLVLITICIAVVTYFFFTSFQEHRRVLEKRWFARGEAALSAGRPADAVEDFPLRAVVFPRQHGVSDGLGPGPGRRRAYG